MKLLSSIFSFETLTFPRTVPKAALLALGVLLGAEFVAERLRAAGVVKSTTVALLVDGYRATLAEERPSLWLMGNSTLNAGFDPDLFSRMTGKSAAKLAHGMATVRGSAALLDFYCKNVPVLPDTVLVLFMKDDVNSRGAGARVSVRYVEEEDWRVPWLERVSSLRACRESLAKEPRALFGQVYRRLTGRSASSAADDPEGIGDPTADGPEKIYAGAPIAADAPWFHDMANDFAMDDGAFAELTRVAKTHEIPRLVVVLVPVTDRFIEFHEWKNPGIPYAEIRARVAADCKSHGLGFLDLGGPSRNYSDFKDPYHMSRAGRETFTKTLAEKLFSTPADSP